MNVKKQEIEIEVGGFGAQCRLFSPEGGGPGVLLLTDIKGIRAVYEANAERLAGEGFTVLLPNVFFRNGRLPMWDFPFVFGEERTMKRMGELTAALSPATQMQDAAAYLEFLRKQRGVEGSALGVVGYCFTGAMAIRAAAACPELVRAAASFHGGNLYADTPESPHRLLPNIRRAALYFGHAVEDRSMSAEAIAKLEAALRQWGGEFTSYTYEGALHGWTNSDSPIYNREQAERAFTDLVAFLRRLLC